MYFLFAFFLLVQAPKAPAAPQVRTLVAGVERLFAQMKDLSAEFIQVRQDSLNRSQESLGHVYLMRSRKLRWEYERPAGNLLVSDGKTAFLYVPADKQVHRSAVRDTYDDRMPLMYLIGRPNLTQEFEKFARLSTKPRVPGTYVIQMYPRRKTDLTELVMEVDPSNYHVRRLLLAHSDGSRTEFIFSNIRTNTGLKASLFEFKVPPGVDVVEGLGQ